MLDSSESPKPESKGPAAKIENRKKMDFPRLFYFVFLLLPLLRMGDRLVDAKKPETDLTVWESGKHDYERRR